MREIRLSGYSAGSPAAPEVCYPFRGEDLEAATADLVVMNRRKLITLIGGTAAAWPLETGAQQQAMPVVGFLHPASLHTMGDRLRAFHQGLKEAGFVEGANVAVEYRWGDNQVDRLPALAAELVRRHVTVIATPGSAAFAVKEATATVPIVFIAGEDPVRIDLVASLVQPGGNLTGINFFAGELGAKRLELMRQLVPAAARVAVLVNPAYASMTELTLRDVEVAARAMGLQTQVINANTSSEIDAAFEIIERECRSYPQRRQACGPACCAVEQI